MIKGAIFDVDGVILDSMYVWNDAMDRFLAKYDKVSEPGLNEKVLSMTFIESAEYFRTTYELPLTGEQILEGIFETIHHYYREEVQLKPGIREVFELLRDNGVKLSIATAGDRRNVVAAFGRLGILDFFDQDSIFTCVELGTGKIRPDVYLKAAERMEIIPDESLVFEDALYAVKTCVKAGFHVAGVYDLSSDNDKDEMRRLTDIYLDDYSNLETIKRIIKN